MTRRKICVVTGSRAEYGLLRPVIEEIRDDPALELQIAVTGMHLSPEFGLTYREIEQDGFAIDQRVEMLLSSDSRVAVAKSTGLGVSGFADAFTRLGPDVVVVLGDRFEIFAAVQAAFFLGLAVAHLNGGEVTEGAMDDSLRHCITKMARVHFTAAEPYRQRVIQLGEQPGSVFNVGDTALDNIARLPLLGAQEIRQDCGLPPDSPYFLVTYHPVTLGGHDAKADMQALLAALDDFPDHAILITEANADMGGRAINQLARAYAKDSDGRAKCVTSLGHLRYLSAMKHCAAVIGNSSSGIIEAPAMKVPTLNIGQRQEGRLKATSVIDCARAEKAMITQSIRKLLDPDFVQHLPQTVSLYGQTDASKRIRDILKSMDITPGAAKRFHDLQRERDA